MIRKITKLKLKKRNGLMKLQLAKSLKNSITQSRGKEKSTMGIRKRKRNPLKEDMAMNLE